ncbi:unnamed protein product [Rotaria sp. Silwood2]|nr:unnamed protein product [Rotaria sp. Silwood2]CAF3305936.1 unnamed protein product [Rotaria sp. Silwood2]CAF4297072.1 unnamed protein product [Rotaria sp. Silwood2]CAF4315618.1 unnamed protein product [Rotaria sp. Silwood2]
MAAEQVPPDGLQTIKEQADFDYWLKQMNGDVQFMHFVVETYKKQQLNEQLNEQRNKKMTHRSRSSSIPSPGPLQQSARHPSRLTDKPITSSSTQHQYQLINNQMTKTHTDITIVPPSLTVCNQTSSTPRRPLDESNSSEFQLQSRTKTSHPYELTPTNFYAKDKITSSSLTTDRQFCFSSTQLKHATSTNLPCFYIHFSLDDNLAQQQNLLSAMKVASRIRHLIQQQSAQSLGDFSLLVPAGKNRYKVGVTTKKDFLLLWNCKWPTDMNKIDIEIERPRALPDSCAVVILYVPADLPREFVTQEISRSIKSAIQFSKINYHQVLSIGRLAIGHVILPITAFIPGLKMTYCNNCWELGHTRYQCKVGPCCRKCLDLWNLNHTCQKSVLCAQCQGPHASLSMECPVVLNYRRILKEEVNNAVKDGRLNQVKVDNKGGTCDSGELDYPALKPKQTNKPRLAWVGVEAASSNLQHFQGTDHLGELVTQMKMVLESTRKMELKLDNQVMQMDLLEKKSFINKQAIFIVQQIEEFKDDLIAKFNSLSVDIDHQQQQVELTSEIPPSIPLNRTTNQIAITSINKGKNVLVDDEQFMEITDV